jgi:hypothetical protein
MDRWPKWCAIVVLMLTARQPVGAQAPSDQSSLPVESGPVLSLPRLPTDPRVPAEPARPRPALRDLDSLQFRDDARQSHPLPPGPPSGPCLIGTDQAMSSNGTSLGCGCESPAPSIGVSLRSLRKQIDALTAFPSTSSNQNARRDAVCRPRREIAKRLSPSGNGRPDPAAELPYDSSRWGNDAVGFTPPQNEPAVSFVRPSAHPPSLAATVAVEAGVSDHRQLSHDYPLRTGEEARPSAPKPTTPAPLSASIGEELELVVPTQLPPKVSPAEIPPAPVQLNDSHEPAPLTTAASPHRASSFEPQDEEADAPPCRRRCWIGEPRNWLAVIGVACTLLGWVGLGRRNVRRTAAQ